MPCVSPTIPVMTPFCCTRCQTTVFFENTHCNACGALLGYHPGQRRMLAYEEEPANGGEAGGASAAWRLLDDAGPGQASGASAAAKGTEIRHRPCANRLQHGVCNWMLGEAANAEPGDTDAAVAGDESDAAAPTSRLLCVSCRLNRTVPDLSVPGHRERWARIEAAKRRLLHTLDALGLMPAPRSADLAEADAKRGLCFDFLARLPDGPAVCTGHANGLITLDIAEADDDHRESVRVQLGEPARTLLGHLRHEVAHYLQYRWIDGNPELSQRCEQVFGDASQDYAQALKRHYQDGPPNGWAERHVSAYASAHPWEDWAETCAHWLLIVDAVNTAAAWGLRLRGPADARPEPLPADALPPARDLVVQQWLPVVQFLNAMNRSIGLHDSYPFLLPPAVVDKLDAVQQLLESAASKGTPTPAAHPSSLEPA